MKKSLLLITLASVLIFAGCTHPTTNNKSGQNQQSGSQEEQGEDLETGEEAVYYTVTISSDIKNGSVTASSTTGIEEGKTVTLTATPAEGYELAGFSVYKTDGATANEKTTANAKNSNIHTFIMPAYDVTVYATFTTRKEISGKIGKYGTPYQAGDIVFNDGSAIPYSEDLMFNSIQAETAIAVIFYTGTKFNEAGDVTKRSFGIGLKAGGKKAYEDESTPTDTATYYAKNYEYEIIGSEVKSRLYGTDYKSGWRIPTVEEFECIYEKKGDIEKAIKLCVGYTFDRLTYYWTSTVNSDDTNKIFRFINEETKVSFSELTKLYNVCVVREFDSNTALKEGRTQVSGKIGKYASAYEAGDIVYKDGSVSEYSFGMDFTSTQKNNAIAIIVDETRKVGVGLEFAEGLAWCVKDVLAYASNDYAKDTIDGEVNSLEIAGLQDSSDGGYPAFYYAIDYGHNIDYISAPYYDSWYLPSYGELLKIKEHIETVNTIIKELGGTEFPVDKNTYFWSSTDNGNEDKFTAYGVSFISGLGWGVKSRQQNVCAVCKF